MANAELLRLGPFIGANLSTDPYYLQPGHATIASNADISYRYGALSTAKGRNLIGSITLPNGYSIQGLSIFTAFYGDNTVSLKRLYVFSATNGSGGFIQGYYDPNNASTTVLPHASPFTQAIQFGSSMWTNGGDRILYLSGVLTSDVWQVQVPFPYSYNTFGTWAAATASVDTAGFTVAAVGASQVIPLVTAYTLFTSLGGTVTLTFNNMVFYGSVTAADATSVTVTTLAATDSALIGVSVTSGTEVDNGAPVDTYTYAITLRKAQAPWTTQGVDPTIYYPDLESLQESSPVFSTSVSITQGQQPGFYVTTGLSLATLISGLTIGGQQYYGCLYRSRFLNPTYTFVDYLFNLVHTTDHDGNDCIIDTYSDDQISNNAFLTIHHDPPPIIGQTYPGAIANNSTALQLQQSAQQVAFTYTNPCFLTKHKGRMWVFTLYPNEPIGTGPPSSPDSISLQPQLWCSDYGTPWSFNDDSAQNQVLLVGPEDTPGNGAIDANIATNPPWIPGLLEDTPMGIASTGSYLVAFKSQRVYVVLGDTPSEFIVQQAFDIGCISTKSITAAEGGIFWLAPQGVYFFNGGSPDYISEEVRGYIESLGWSTLQAAVGAYRDRTFYLSFPGQETLCYYLPSKKWYTLPYSTSLAVSSSFDQNLLVFVNGSGLDQVDVNPATDLLQPIVATWQSNITDSQAPGQLKSYRYAQIVASPQPGIATLTLVLDQSAAISNVCEVVFDLSKGNGAHVASLPQAMRGYEAQVTVSVQTDTELTHAPIQIRSVVISGEVADSLTAPQTTDLYTMRLNGDLIYP